MGGRGVRFPTTRWTHVARLQDPAAAEYGSAVNELARDYWKPVYAYIRASWRKGNEDAKDSTQEFFAFLMEKKALKLVRPGEGRFRLLLQTVLRHFLIDDHRREARLRRGGRTKVVAIDDAALPVEDPAAKSPEAAFDRAWARMLVAEGVAEMERRARESGRGHPFQAFRLRYADLFSEKAIPADDASLEELARQAGRTLSKFKNDLVAARAEFRAVVLDRVRAIAGSEREAQEELRYLLSLL